MMLSLRQPIEGSVLERVVRESGCKSLYGLAKLLGLSHMAMFKWQHKYIPESRALELEVLTQGRVTAEEILKDSARRRELIEDFKVKQIKALRETLGLK